MGRYQTTFAELPDYGRVRSLAMFAVLAEREGGIGTEVIGLEPTIETANELADETTWSGRYGRLVSGEDWTDTGFHIGVDAGFARLHNSLSPDDAVVALDELLWSSSISRGNWRAEVQDGVVMSTGPMPLEVILELDRRNIPAIQDFWVVIRERPNTEPSVYAIEFDRGDAMSHVYDIGDGWDSPDRGRLRRASTLLTSDAR